MHTFYVDDRGKNVLFAHFVCFQQKEKLDTSKVYVSFSAEHFELKL